MDYNHRITKVEFGLLSPEEILEYSVVEITKTATYENGKPVPGGLNDPKMGSIEFQEKCQTCYLGQECPGHFGHIVLEVPVFNPLYIGGSRMGNNITIKSVLECICVRCAKLLIDIPDDIEIIKDKKRMTMIKQFIGSKKECRSKHGCAAKQPKYSFSKYNELLHSYGTERKEKLHPQFVLNLFRRIDDDTVRAFGINPKFARPEWMILTILPVPPPSLRPAIKSESAKHEDDLVSAFIDIIKQNKNLRNAKELKNEKTYKNYIDLINVYINAMMTGRSKTGDIVVVFSTGGKPLKSIKDRISNKEGRLRGNLNGKRVDFSARTVITPDPNIGLDELGIPIEIAMNLTFPEIVTSENKEAMYRLLYNGNKVYPGVNRIKQNGDMREMKYLDPKSIVLQEGDEIHRHLQDGDAVLFNRQPSLHKMSMMTHRAVILPEKTFRLNVSATTPYNADFDGDEMNMYMPQSMLTSVELLETNLVPSQIVTPATSKSIIGIVQDSLIGSYLMTSDNTPPIDKKRYFNSLVWHDTFNGEMVDIKKSYTGKELMSQILPPLNYKTFKGELTEIGKELNGLVSYIKSKGLVEYIENINYLNTPEIKDEVLEKINALLAKDVTNNEKKILTIIKNKISKNSTIKLSLAVGKLEELANKRKAGEIVDVDIDNGTLRKGRIGGKLIKPGAGDSSLIYATWQDINKDEAKFFINRLQRMVNYWLMEHGHTVGVGDIVIQSPELAQQIPLEILKAYEVYGKLEKDIIRGKLIPGIGRTVEQEFEFKSKLILNDVFNGKLPKLIGKYLDENNNLANMVNSGSKGSSINITQIMGCVGPQAIGGERIPKNYGGRTLPHYTKFDDHPQARGFIENSFEKGLEPQEFFFHMGGGREGLIDTAIKTAESGYISRKLVKSMEDLSANYDYVVRNSISDIVQFIYGDNGLNPTFTRHMKVGLLDYNNDKVKNMYHFTENEIKEKVDSVIYNNIFSSGNKKNTEEILSGEYLKLLYFRKLLREFIYSTSVSADVEFLSPANIKKFVVDINGEFNYENPKKSLLDPVYIVGKVNGLCRLLPKLFKNNVNNVKQYIDVDYTLDDEYIDGETEESLFNNPLDESKLIKIINAEKDDYVAAILLLKIYIKSELSSKNVICKYKLTKEKFDYLLDMIIYKFIRAVVDPGEMVGVLAAQSIGEPTTQATLNSVVYDTEILVKVGKVIRKFKIGKFVEYFIGKSEKVEYHKPDMTWAEIPEKYSNISIQSVDEDGNVSWKKIEAVTRHPVINEDGSNTMVKVRTAHGREITATFGESFLQVKGGKLVASRGDELIVGDYLPVSTKAIKFKEVHYLDMSKVLAKLEFVYGSEIKKAIDRMDEVDAERKRLEEENPDKYKKTGGWSPYSWWNMYSTRVINRDKIITKFIDENELKKMDEEQKSKMFTIPYQRSDNFRDAVKGTWKTNKSNKKFSIRIFEDNKIYTLAGGSDFQIIPEKIPMDYDFGYLIGAYASEGCCQRLNDTNPETGENIKIAGHQISIANLDEDYFKPIERFCKKANITFKYYKKDMTYRKEILKERKRELEKLKLSEKEQIEIDVIEEEEKVAEKFSKINKGKKSPNIDSDFYVPNKSNEKEDDEYEKGDEKKWWSRDIRIYSTILTHFMFNSIGCISHLKIIPNYFVHSNKEFIKGFLDAYIGGDGHVSADKNVICISSTSIKMLQSMQLMLNILGIYSHIHEHKKITKNNLGTHPDNIRQMFSLRITAKQASKLASTIKIHIDYKQEGLDILAIKPMKYLFKCDEIKYQDIENGERIKKDRNDEFPDVFFDKIVSIEHVPCPNDYVYDLTIEGTRNIVLRNGSCQRDTFHLAGVSAKSNVIQGVPRIKELISGTKDIKTPLLQAYVNKEYAGDKYRAKVLANSIEYTKICDFAESVEIFFDPNIKNSVIKEDADMIKEYYSNNLSAVEMIPKLSKFVMRIVLDKKQVIYKQLRMNYIKFKIEEYKNGVYYCIASDDNAKKLVLHIRIDMSNVFNKNKTELKLIKDSEDIILNDVIIRGIKNIESVQIDNTGDKLIVYDEKGDRIQQDEWIIYTSGTNLKLVLAQPGVDPTRTISNDIYEAYRVLGIEAARQLLYDQLNEVYSATGAHLNYHHLGLLVDLMTHAGKIMPINRHGINRTDNSVMTKMSFEETQEQATEASIYGIEDNLKGISGNVMLGQTIPAGTGYTFDVFYDTRSGEFEDIEEPEFL